MKQKLIAACPLIIALSLSMSAIAANTTDDPARPSIGRSGELFAVQFIPKDKKLVVGLAGKPMATLDPNEITVMGRVLPMKGQKRDLKIVRIEGHFQIVDPINEKDQVEIEVKDQKTQKKETFKFEPKQRVP